MTPSRACSNSWLLARLCAFLWRCACWIRPQSGSTSLFSTTSCVCSTHPCLDTFGSSFRLLAFFFALSLRPYLFLLHFVHLLHSPFLFSSFLGFTFSLSYLFLPFSLLSCLSSLPSPSAWSLLFRCSRPRPAPPTSLFLFLPLIPFAFPSPL